MASESEGKARSNKQSTVTLTLPVSCQICLGKVKQPVLCPNLHVFCNLCLDIWLKRNSQCPACRVEIGPDNPVKHIIGGQIEDNSENDKSTPELRRARFDLLYKEYEDQFQQIRKEIIILRTENNILIAQLKDAEEENEQYKKGNKPEASKSSQPPDGPSLLRLTKNLQEAEKLYAGIKDDMAKLKQENSKLKDENVNLTRENETLRLEIAQRSPKKFGRYTVATLETKLAEKDKEIKQLTKALERSDTYIEELQRQVEKLSTQKGRFDRDIGRRDDAGKTRERFQINLEPKKTIEEGAVSKPDNARRILFSKVFVDDSKKQTSQPQAVGVNNAKRSSLKQNDGHAVISDCHEPYEQSHTHEQQMGLFHQRSRGPDVAHSSNDHDGGHHHGQSSGYSFPHKQAEEQRSGSGQPHESIMKTRSRSSQVMPAEDGDSAERERTPRKVHFNVTEKTNDTSSFNLELPSPMEKSSLNSVSQISDNDKMISASRKTMMAEDAATDAFNTGNFDAIPKTEFDIKVQNLLRMNNVQGLKSSSAGDVSSESDTSQSNKKSGKSSSGKKKTSGKVKTSSKVTKKVQSKALESHDTNDSSRLSVPDMGSPASLSEFDQNLDIKRETVDLDMSMTPEMTDCLQLMDRAEKNIGVPTRAADDQNLMPPPSYNGKLPASSYSNSSSASTLQVPRPSSVPPHLPSNRPSSYLAASSTTGGSGFAPSSSTISSWEQQFFSTLRANPYKFNNNASKPHDQFARSELHSEDYKKFTADGESKNFYRSLDVNPSKGRSDDKDFHFSEPIRISHPEYLPGPTQQAIQGTANPFALQLGKPGLSKSSGASTSTYQASSLGYSHFTTSNTGTYSHSTHPFSASVPISSSRSSALSSSSSVPQALPDKYNHILSSYSSDLPSYKSGFSSSQSSHRHNNPLPPSLNNSALEWPDDTPGRGYRNDSDDLPRPSHRHSSAEFDSFTTDFRPSHSSGRQSHYNYASNASSSDINTSTYLPEPKKRLFDNDDDLDFAISPKTTRR